MLQRVFRDKHSLLQPYLYLGWRRAEIDGHRRIVFCVGVGSERARAKANFRGVVGSDVCLVIEPQNEI